MLTKFLLHVENFVLGISLITVIFLTSFWSDGIQNLNYWEYYTGISFQTLLFVVAGLLIVSFIITKVLRSRGILQNGTLIIYSLVTIVLTIWLLVDCLQMPFIQGQWLTSILPPPIYLTWKIYMTIFSYLILAMLLLHFLYIAYSVFRLVLIPPVQNMILMEEA
ncbi:MAG: hypothetical protein JSR09_03800 [Bacteroidetes bacterium]|nr:hypothetical protein [Bacteroidota bacterium]MBS1648808.1 hypothetical protein [Bacteroidota bacterium]